MDHRRLRTTALKDTVKYTYDLKVKRSCYRPRGFQEVKVPRLHDNGTGWW